jgi:glutamate dehydrogenase
MGRDVAIQGFGILGRVTAKLSELGCKIVTVSDSKGAVYDPNGLDIREMGEREGAVIPLHSLRGYTDPLA